MLREIYLRTHADVVHAVGEHSAGARVKERAHAPLLLRPCRHYRLDRLVTQRKIKY